MEHQNPDQESVNKNLVSNTHTMNYKLVFNIKKKYWFQLIYNIIDSRTRHFMKLYQIA